VAGEPSGPLVVAGDDLPAATSGVVGSKAATLVRIAGEGIAVPRFHVVSSLAFVLHLRENGIGWPGTPAEWSKRDRVASLRDRISAAPVPDAVARAVADAYEDLCSGAGHDRVAVRSSAAEEDAPSASYAGRFSSFLGIEGTAAVCDAVRACWASYVSEGSLDYRFSRGTLPGAVPSFAVILQTQVFSDKAGVLFTVHPFDPGRGTAHIEANFGTGESVVGGLATPDALTLSRSGGEVVETRIGSKRRMTVVAPASGGSTVVDVDTERRGARVLTDAEAAAVLETGLRLERLLGGPQDVEWAFDRAGLWILQSRPVTAGPGA
jgi:pyruvate,water dikinase